MELRNRLLVIVDPGGDRSDDQRDGQDAAIERARWLARQLEAPVDLRIYYQALPGLGEQFIDSRVLEMAVEQMRRERLEDLEELAKPLRGEGLTVTVDAVAGSPVAESILADIIALRPRLVLKAADHHVPLSRAFFSETDWQLMRTSPSPVLMVRREHTMPERPTLIAAVDPLHEHDKPAALDDKILATASELAMALEARLQVVHCYDVTPLVTGMAASPVLPAPLQTEELAESLEAHHRRALDELVADRGLPADAVHLLEGAARWRLPEFCAEADADIVVMGAVSRSALERVFIGGLAEKVLDRLPCDLLIVKPDGFVCPEMVELAEGSSPP